MKIYLKHTILLFLFSTSTFSQVKMSTVFGEFTINKLSNNTYQIKDSTGIVALSNLKYVSKVGHFIRGAIQVLDHNNKLIFYDRDLKKMDSTYKINNFQSRCGTVKRYRLEVLEHTKFYTLQKSVGYNSRFNETKIIDTIYKKNIDSLYFFNHQKILKYNENRFYPENLILVYNQQLQIYNRNQRSVKLNKIDSTDPRYPRVKKNELWGYMYISYDLEKKPKQITKIKYEILEPYNFNLAYFKLENGQSGYVDKQGNEFYNN
jgi:hypothetical protein